MITPKILKNKLQKFPRYKFAHLPTPLEKIESIDMLRVIENGGIVRTVQMHNKTLGVDTSEDLKKVRKLMKNDALMARYDN